MFIINNKVRPDGFGHLTVGPFYIHIIAYLHHDAVFRNSIKGLRAHGDVSFGLC